MQMTETIGVMFIFFVLIAFGLLFYFQYQKGAIKEKEIEMLADRAMDTTALTLYLPELACSKGDAEPEGNCFDLMKLRSLNNTAMFDRYSNQYYFDIFSYSKITIKQLYPENYTWVLYNKPKTRIVETENGTQVIADWTIKEPTYFVVVLKDESVTESNPTLEPIYNYGYMQVEVYS